MNFQLAKCALKRNATHCLQVTRIGRHQRKIGFAMPTTPLIPYPTDRG